MENKESYTPEEVEQAQIEAVEAIIRYRSAIFSYKVKKEKNLEIFNNDKRSLEEVKKEVNDSVEKCNQKLPKSLIDKFEIKKIK
ncbi:MAG: hypothetical protein WC812_03380 [Candidatus Pacearchaeota archaeon]|jgi:hypothetical protein